MAVPRLGTVVLVVIVCAAVVYAVIPKAPPAPKGVFIIGRGIDPDILDPTRTVFDPAMHTISLIYDTLLTYDLNMNKIPLLAESYEVYPEWIDFYLRRDVRFHCGHPFNAEAVEKAIWRKKYLPGSKHVASVAGLDVEVIDDYHVRIHLKEEDRYAVDWFATPSSSIECPHCAEKYGPEYGVKYVCGTGPFKFVRWERDREIVLTRNPEYKWGPAWYFNRGPAHIENVIFRVIPEDMVRAAELEAGRIHFMMPPIPEEDKKRFEKDNRIVIYRAPRLSLEYLGFHVGGGRYGNYDLATHKWVDENGKELEVPGGKFVGDVRVRRAIAHAIDKEEIIEKAVAGEGFPAYGYLTPGHRAYWKPSENYYRYDPERAKELLAEAGFTYDPEKNRWFHPDGSKLVVELLATEPYKKHADVIYYNLEEVGIECDVKVVEFGYLMDRVTNREHQMYLMGWDWPYEDILFWMHHPKRTPAPNRNWWDRDGPQPEEAIKRTFASDDNVFLEACYEVQRMLLEDCVYVPLRVREMVQAVRAEVKGYRIHPWPCWTWKFLDIRIEE